MATKQFTPVPKNVINLTGRQFVRLTVLGFVGTRNHYAEWLCTCTCGNTTIVRSRYLLGGDTKSCGCLKVSIHGAYNSPEHKSWKSMLRRVTDPRVPSYAKYAERGITICDRWLDFNNFLSDMGPRPSANHSIDRIDNDGNYEPGNCRWATSYEQQNNKRNNRRVTHNGETLTVADWSKRTGLAHHVICRRLDAGWTAERVLTTPHVANQAEISR